MVLMTRDKVCARTGIPATPRARTWPRIATGLHRPDLAGLRAALLGTVAAGALCVVAPRSAAAGPDACVVGPANVVTCSGNQSGGIGAGPSGDFNPVPGTRLVVNNLTQDIGSLSSSANGIQWALSANSLPVDVTSNTGSFSIRASAAGINLSGNGQSVTLNHTGNIFADTGINATSSGVAGGGNISVSMNGNIVSDSSGIRASSRTLPGDADTAPVIVNFTGNITSATRQAISAESSVRAGNGLAGTVTINSNGEIVGSVEALSRVSGNGISGAVNVSHQGSLTDGRLTAASTVQGGGLAGPVTISNAGNISGGVIRALSRVNGIGDAAAVSVTNAGNISSTEAGALISALSQGGGIVGNAGSVSVTSTGDLTGGTGIEALSETAGVGNTGNVVVGHTGNILGSRGIFAASTSETDGTAGAVTVTSVGGITATGSSGISAFSGARVGDSGPVRVDSTGNIVSATGGVVAESRSVGGNAAATTVTSTGNIDAGNAGILATSVSSGAGTAAGVTVTSNGNINATNSAIFARSSGGGGQGNIQVAINGGTVRGGDAGVAISGGAANALTIGSNAALLATSGLAITGDTGNETIGNSGQVTGNVILGAGTNVFNNFAGAMFNAGSIVDLGGLGGLTNAGTFAPGGVGGTPVTTTFTGANFVQAAGGTFAVDVANGAADRVNISGAASLAGTVAPTIRGLVTSAQQFTILSAAGGTTNNGITVRDTATVDYELLFPNANDMVLTVSANFNPQGAELTPNQRVTAAHLQSAFGAGGGGLGGLFGHLGGLPDVASYARALDRLHAEPYLAPVKSVVLGNLGFTDSLMSCPKAASTGASAYIAEGQCVWARMGGRVLNVDRSVANIGYQDKTWSASTGVQFALAPSWFGSVAAGYEKSDIKVDNRASATGDVFHVGAAAKYINGNWQFSGALTGGHARYDVTRRDVMPGVNAMGDQSLSFLSGRVRTAYVFGTGNGYVKPLVDFDAVGILRGGIVETGAGPVGLNVHRQTDALFSVAPAVEVGGQFGYANGIVLRPFARAGVRVFSESDLAATASFIGSPQGVPAFTVTSPLARWLGEVSTGLEVLRTEVYDARVSYDGRYGENITQHGGSVKVRAKF
jgi:hypothetical protein